MKKIKIFTTNRDAINNSAGEDLTTLVEDWIEETGAIIEGIHSNSNKYGWMIVITYSLTQ